jgi:hypothetical protein
MVNGCISNILKVGAFEILGECGAPSGIARAVLEGKMRLDIYHMLG